MIPERDFGGGREQSLKGVSAFDTLSYSGRSTEGIFLTDPETGILYFLKKSGEVSKKDYETGEFLPVDTHSDDFYRVHELEARDQAIFMARRRTAEKIAEGDILLENILLQADTWTREQLEHPYRRGGIDLYKVGGNLDHEFFLGTKNDRLYCYAPSDKMCIKDMLCVDLQKADEMTAEEFRACVTPEVIQTTTERIVRKVVDEFVLDWLWTSDADSNEDYLVDIIDDDEFYTLFCFVCNRNNDYEERNDAEDRLKQRALELWSDTIHSLIEKVLYSPDQNSEEVVVFPGVHIPVEVELVSEPEDVTEKEELYISSPGAFIHPQEMRKKTKENKSYSQ